MPSLRPNFIFRGARLATQMTNRPTSVSGAYASLIPAKTVFCRVAAEAERQLEQLLGVRHVFGRDDAGDTQIDLREIVDRALGSERLSGERIAGIVRAIAADVGFDERRA